MKAITTAAENKKSTNPLAVDYDARYKRQQNIAI